MSYLTVIDADMVGVRTSHQAVMSLFPVSLPGTENMRRVNTNILFAVDGTRIIIRSDIEPTRVPVTAKTVRTPLEDVAEPGDIIRFRVTVNAVRRLRGGGTAPVADIDSWIEQRLSSALDEVTVLAHERSVVHSGHSPLQLDVVDGQAVVTDVLELQRLMREGVGRGRAFGCGLLLVAA